MESFLVDIPLSVHRRAKAIAEQQRETAQAEIVYRNNLAVYATHVYMRCMGIPVDLGSSDSQDILFQTLSNTGALMLSGVGKLECRPVAHNAENMYVPEDVWGDRIGYIAVQFNADLSEANLLGFVPAVSGREIPLAKLKSLSELLDRLEILKTELQTAQQPVIAMTATRLQSENVVYLSQWLNRTIESGWQIIEDFLDNIVTSKSDQLEPAIAFRQTIASQSEIEAEIIQCGKVIQLGDSLDHDQLQLVIGLRPQTEDKYQVRIQLRPIRVPYLIPGLEVSLLNNLGETVSKSQMSQHQPYFELKLGAHKGDSFSLRTRYADSTFEQQFVF
jgi:hypothetical protein